MFEKIIISHSKGRTRVLRFDNVIGETGDSGDRIAWFYSFNQNKPLVLVKPLRWPHRESFVLTRRKRRLQGVQGPPARPLHKKGVVLEQRLILILELPPEKIASSRFVPHDEDELDNLVVYRKLPS